MYVFSTEVETQTPSSFFSSSEEGGKGSDSKSTGASGSSGGMQQKPQQEEEFADVTRCVFSGFCCSECVNDSGRPMTPSPLIHPMHQQQPKPASSACCTRTEPATSSSSRPPSSWGSTSSPRSVCGGVCGCVVRRLCVLFFLVVAHVHVHGWLIALLALLQSPHSPQFDQPNPPINTH